MKELVEFRRLNHLTQDQLGYYLGMQKSFISKIENGREKFPRDKFQKLLDNKEGWDVEMLRKVDLDLENLYAGWIAATSAPNDPSHNKSWEQKKIEMLEKRIEQLEQQNAEYWELIKKLTDK